MKIDPIEEWTTDFFLIAKQVTRRAGTATFRIGRKPTRTRILTGHKSKSGGEAHGPLGSRNSDNTVFQGLSEGLQNIAWEFWELIEEEYAAMRQGNFTRSGHLATTNERRT